MTMATGYDLGFLSPLLRILPAVSGFFNIPGLYYVKAGKNSRFEFRTNDMTLYIGAYCNLLFITNNSNLYESRSKTQSANVQDFNHIDPSAYDAVFLISREYISSLFSEQDPKIASILDNIDLDSVIEAGLFIDSRKFEFNLSANISSNQTVFSRFIGQRSRSSDMADRIPTSAQYARFVLNPIIDWTDNDIWDFLRLRNVSVNPLYKKGYKWIGCIGCPMSTNVKRQLDEYPKYKSAYQKAANIYWLHRKEIADYPLDGALETPETYFEWWLRGRNMKNKRNCFITDFWQGDYCGIYFRGNYFWYHLRFSIFE